MCVVLAYAKSWWYTTNRCCCFFVLFCFLLQRRCIFNDNFDCFNQFSSLLSCSVSHGFLQSTASYSVHVWGTGHPQHRRAASPPHRLPPSQIHQRNQRYVCLCARPCSSVFMHTCSSRSGLCAGLKVEVTHCGTMRRKSTGSAMWPAAPPATKRESNRQRNWSVLWRYIVLIAEGKVTLLEYDFLLILKVHSAICFQIKKF